MLVAGACASTAPAASPAASPAAPREWRVGDQVLVTALAPNVWRHTSWGTYDGKRVPANGLVVRDGGEIVLIDTAWGEEATALLLDLVRRELGAPVTMVVATHSHEDRVGAPQTLAGRGIPLLVHPKTAALAAKRGVTTTKALEGFASADTVTIGGVELFHPGGAHTSDNIVVWIPAARVLFGGCAVKSADATDLGFVGDADLAHWPGAMQALQTRYAGAAIVVPGHGDPGDRQLVQHTLDLLAARDDDASGDKAGGPR